jgi:membrane-associated phospholipid phosphatase
LKQAAKIISAIGNPLCLGILFGIYNFVELSKYAENAYLPLVSIAIVLVPLAIFVYLKVKKGQFHDYDVSNRLKRKSVYRLILILLLLAIFSSLFIPYPKGTVLINSILFLQIGLSYLINEKLKISMHTSFSFLFAYLFYPLSKEIFIGLFVFGFFNGYSRLVLNRHKPSEVMAGFIMGNACGLLYLCILYFYGQF